jgi:hypothetical protein
VRHHDERAATAEQVGGEPGDAGHVEVVRRLVQHEQVARADQQRGQGDPAAFASGHRADRRVEAEVGQAESR